MFPKTFGIQLAKINQKRIFYAPLKLFSFPFTFQKRNKISNLKPQLRVYQSIYIKRAMLSNASKQSGLSIFVDSTNLLEYTSTGHGLQYAETILGLKKKKMNISKGRNHGLDA